MKSLIKLILFSLVCIIIFGCTKGRSDLASASGIFPGELGLVWHYSIFDSKANTFKDLKVSIVSDTAHINGLPVKTMLYEYPTFTDKNFLYSTKDTVKIFETLSASSGLYGYVFPLETGKSWTDFNGYMYWDSTKIIRQLSIEVFPDRYYDGFEIERKGWIFEGGYGTIIWFVPGIGEVKSFDYHLSSPGHVYTELKSINFEPVETSGINIK